MPSRLPEVGASGSQEGPRVGPSFGMGAAAPIKVHSFQGNVTPTILASLSSPQAMSVLRCTCPMFAAIPCQYCLNSKRVEEGGSPASSRTQADAGARLPNDLEGQPGSSVDRWDHHEASAKHTVPTDASTYIYASMTSGGSGSSDNCKHMNCFSTYGPLGDSGFCFVL